MKKDTYHTLEQATNVLLAQTNRPQVYERRNLFQAIGRTAAEDIFAHMAQPPFDRSPLDGYAVRHLDIANASNTVPVELHVTQHIHAGEIPKGPVMAGEAACVMTGSPLPPGATCVVRQEDTDNREDIVRICYPLSKNQNVCRKGEDVPEGAPLVQRGQRLDAAQIALLGGQGYTEVNVYPHPKIGILSTGSELTTGGHPLAPGKIYDSNRYYLASRVMQLGGLAVLGASAPDDPDRLAQAIGALLLECDLVITTGGVSVGAHDYMPAVGKLLEYDELFHGVAMKPGGPAMALAKNEKLALCLSGNPFAAAATFEMLARPVVLKMCGDADVLPKSVKAVLQNGFQKASHGRRFLRARIEGNTIYLPNGHSSGMMASMAACNCLVDIPAGSPPLEPGNEVKAVLL